MKAKITTFGKLFLIAENETEEYALLQWIKNKDKCKYPIGLEVEKENL